MELAVIVVFAKFLLLRMCASGFSYDRKSALRQVLFIVRAGVAEVVKIQLCAFYQFKILHTG